MCDCNKKQDYQKGLTSGYYRTNDSFNFTEFFRWKFPSITSLSYLSKPDFAIEKLMTTNYWIEQKSILDIKTLNFNLIPKLTVKSHQLYVYMVNCKRNSKINCQLVIVVDKNSQLYYLAVLEPINTGHKFHLPNTSKEVSEITVFNSGGSAIKKRCNERGLGLRDCMQCAWDDIESDATGWFFTHTVASNLIAIACWIICARFPEWRDESYYSFIPKPFDYSDSNVDSQFVTVNEYFHFVKI